MDNHDQEKFLNTADYIVIGFAMAVSAGIGIYFRFAGGKQKTKEEYLLAGKNMSILPVAFSLMATFMSTATLMGIPTEMYVYGTHMAFMNIGINLGIIASSYVFVPVYFNAQVSTSYEYIEKRFGSLARTVCSLGFTLQAILYMGVVLYTPALALSAVTNLSTWTSVIIIAIVCTFYCTIGGMKAVLWTDFFQATLMFACIVSILIKGCIDLGGISNVFQIANEGKRLVVPSISLSFSLRYTIWNILFMAFFMCCFTFGTSQLQVQRALSVKSALRARKAMIISALLTNGFHILCCITGLIIYATFHTCDPLSIQNTPLTSADQLVPYYVMVRLRQYPGLPGLCICGIFAASLSTVSSYIQSLTVVTIEDFLQPFCSKYNFKVIQSTFCAKALTLFYGALGLLLAYITAFLGTVMEAAIAVFSLFGGPLSGLFFLGVLTTAANEKGATLGLISSLGFVTWLTFGHFSGSSQGKLPVSTSGCIKYTNSTSNFTDTLVSFDEFFTSPIYEVDMMTTPTGHPEMNEQRLSHMWITPIGMVISYTLGYMYSLLFNYITGNKQTVESKYLSPVRVWWMERHRTSAIYIKRNIKETTIS